MEENLMNADTRKTEKIKTHHARIVVDGTAEKPYYSIEWFDPVRKEYFLGYSSYFIENVFKWLSECFEIVEATKTNADRIRAMSDEELAEWMTAIRIDTINEICKRFDVEIEMPTPTVENTVDVCKWLQQPAEGD